MSSKAMSLKARIRNYAKDNRIARDFYDAYILGTTQIFDKQLFEEALAATAEHRGSTELIEDRIGIIERLAENYDLRNMWEKYRQRFSYASEIEYEDIIRVLRELLR